MTTATMTPMHRRLVRHLLAQGATMSVDGGGDDLDLERSSSRADIVSALEAVYQAELIIHCCTDRLEERTEWALVIPHGVDADETVADYGGDAVDAFMDAQPL